MPTPPPHSAGRPGPGARNTHTAGRSSEPLRGRGNGRFLRQPMAARTPPQHLAPSRQFMMFWVVLWPPLHCCYADAAADAAAAAAAATAAVLRGRLKGAAVLLVVTCAATGLQPEWWWNCCCCCCCTCGSGGGTVVLLLSLLI
jgi:hypothetical protein